jgi:3-keto-disaccharide hydrolase
VTKGKLIVLHLLMIITAISFLGCVPEQGCQCNNEWIDLFNGKDLSGWTPKVTGYRVNENPSKLFRVEKGILKVSYDKYDKFSGQFGHLFYAEKFSNYILRVEYRFTGRQAPLGPGWAFRNSGVMIHSQSPQSMRVGQDFPIAIEAQMLGGDGMNSRSTGNLYTPGTNVFMNGRLITDHCISSNSQTYHGDQWVTMEIEVHGNNLIKHIVNGEVVMQYTQPQLDERDPDALMLLDKQGLMLSGGFICLQAKSHPVEFRKVQIILLNE